MPTYAFKQSKLNFLHLASTNLQAVFAKGMAMFFIQDLAAPAVSILAAKAGNSSTLSWSSGITSPVHPRSVQVVFAASWDGGNITITGYDQFGRAQTELITASAGNTVQGVKVWKTITLVAKSAVGAQADTFTLQTGADLVGLPVPLLGAWGVGCHDGIAELCTWNATYHAFKPTTTPDGSVDFTVLVPVDWAAYKAIVNSEAPDV